MKTFLICLFCAFALYHTSFSNEWSKLNFPNGIQITCILALDENTVLAGTGIDMMGVSPSYGLIKSNDGGNSWQTIQNTGFSNKNIDFLYKSDDGSLFTISGSTNLFKSTDNGENWTKLGTNFTQINYCIKADNGNIFVSGNTSFSKFYVSTDAGVTWTEKSGFAGIMGMAKDESGNLYILKENSGVWKSTDNGTSFNDISGTTLDDKNCRSILIDSDNNFWVTSWNSIFYSSDQGENWNERLAGMESYSHNPKGSTIAQNPITKEVIIGLLYGGVKVFDADASAWKNYSATQPVESVNTVSFSSQGRCFVGDNSSGLAFSNDNGISWKTPDIGAGKKLIYELASYNDFLLVGTGDGGVFKYSFTENKCIQLKYPPLTIQSFVMNIFVTKEGTLLTSVSGSGFYRSTDLGTSWTNIFQQNPFMPETIISAGDALYAADRFENKGVFKSTDDGLTWVKETGDISGLEVYSLAVNSAGDIFAGTNLQGVYKKSAATGLWLKTNFPSKALVGYMVINSNDNIFAAYAGAENFISKSTDNGETFKNLDFVNPVISMTIVNSNNNNADDIFIGSSSTCYKISDSKVSENVEEISGGFSGTYIRAITYHPQSNRIIAGGMVGGLHSYSLGAVSVNDNQSVSNFEIFPNPANDFITIQTTEVLKNSEGGTIKLFDMLGIEIRNLNFIKSINDDDIKIDISDLQSGVYFIKMNDKVVKFVKK